MSPRPDQLGAHPRTRPDCCLLSCSKFRGSHLPRDTEQDTAQLAQKSVAMSLCLPRGPLIAIGANPTDSASNRGAPCHSHPHSLPLGYRPAQSGQTWKWDSLNLHLRFGLAHSTEEKLRAPGGHASPRSRQEGRRLAHSIRAQRCQLRRPPRSTELTVFSFPRLSWSAPRTA